MRILSLLVLCSSTLACETMQLYEGDRDGFSRLVEVMDPVDIRPNDRRAVALPPTMGQPLAPPTASPGMPRSVPAPPATGFPQPGAIPMPPATPPAGALPAPTPGAPLPPTPAFPQPGVKPKPPTSVSPPASGGQSARLPEPISEMPDAARLAKKPLPKQTARLSLDEPQSAAPKRIPAAPKANTDLRRKPTFEPPPTKPRAKLPAVPAAPMPRADVPVAIPSTPPPAPSMVLENEPPQPLALKSKVKSSVDGLDKAGPSARDQGRPLIKRTEPLSQPSAFGTADNPLLGTEIGGAMRPVGPRTPQITRQVVGSAKGALAECYVNEQLFQDDAKGTAVVVIEVPKELPNRPRIETSDFSETMNACLLDAVRQLPFPGDPEGAAYRLRIPFRFRPD